MQGESAVKIIGQMRRRIPGEHIYNMVCESIGKLICFEIYLYETIIKCNILVNVILLYISATKKHVVKCCYFTTHTDLCDLVINYWDHVIFLKITTSLLSTSLSYVHDPS